jgi:hypothetical protein
MNDPSGEKLLQPLAAFTAKLPEVGAAAFLKPMYAAAAGALVASLAIYACERFLKIMDKGR